MAHWNYAIDSSAEGGGIVSVAYYRPEVYVSIKNSGNFDVIDPLSSQWPQASTTNSTQIDERFIPIFHETSSTRYVSEAPEWICYYPHALHFSSPFFAQRGSFNQDCLRD